MYKHFRLPARRGRAATAVFASVCQARPARPRLCVFRSLKHIYAQVIDDSRGMTLPRVLVKSRRFAGRSTAPRPAARRRWASWSRGAPRRGVEKVVFDRGGYIYHGRVKALADAAVGRFRPRG